MARPGMQRKTEARRLCRGEGTHQALLSEVKSRLARANMRRASSILGLCDLASSKRVMLSLWSSVYQVCAQWSLMNPPLPPPRRLISASGGAQAEPAAQRFPQAVLMKNRTHLLCFFRSHCAEPPEILKQGEPCDSAPSKREAQREKMKKEKQRKSHLRVLSGTKSVQHSLPRGNSARKAAEKRDVLMCTETDQLPAALHAHNVSQFTRTLSTLTKLLHLHALLPLSILQFLQRRAHLVQPHPRVITLLTHSS